MKKILLLTVSILLSVASMYAQQSSLDQAQKLAKGLRLDNNRIVFNDKAQLEAVYDELEELNDNYIYPDISEDEEEDLFMRGVEIPLGGSVR
jgi:hypothetical protein